ncbi:hypothetical protein ACZ91_04250 [Streptomyces regensis]|nr:hypothetical protein ACZ91_04250 [Streptomyces regensis]
MAAVTGAPATAAVHRGAGGRDRSRSVALGGVRIVAASAGRSAARHPPVPEAPALPVARESSTSRGMAREVMPAGTDPGLAAEVIVLGGSQVIAQQMSNGYDGEDAVVAREPARSYWCGVYRRPED